MPGLNQGGLVAVLGACGNLKPAFHCWDKQNSPGTKRWALLPSRLQPRSTRDSYQWQPTAAVSLEYRGVRS